MGGDKKRIVISSDHAGFAMKEFLKSQLESLGIGYEDLGTTSEDSVGYPLFAARVARRVGSGASERGITLCGTGLGASMTANKFHHVRAALCCTEEMAELSRRHNNANVLVLGGRITTPETAGRILRTWLATPFDGGRHTHRVAQIDEVAASPDEPTERGDRGHE